MPVVFDGLVLWRTFPVSWLTSDADASFKSPSFRQQMISTLEKVADGDYHQVTTCQMIWFQINAHNQQREFKVVSCIGSVAGHGLPVWFPPASSGSG
jgi:hypothetical protein